MDGKWPPNVAAQLKARYFDEAAGQIGTDASNDFMHGELPSALWAILAAGIVNGKVFVGTPTGVAEFGLMP
jgi:hypothetical protein